MINSNNNNKEDCRECECQCQCYCSRLEELENIPTTIHKGRQTCDCSWWCSPCNLKPVLKKLDDVEDLLTNPNYGLSEIKTEVKNIERTTSNPMFGLPEIKKEVFCIEKAIYNPTYGLEEIKSEIRGIEDKLNNSSDSNVGSIKNDVEQLVEFVNTSNKTTGSVVADTSATSIVINLYNNTDSAKLVSATVYTLTSSGKSVAYTTGAVGISPQSALEFETSVVPNLYEVEFNGLVQGVYGWTSARTIMTTGSFIAANTFNHSDLVPTTI